MRPTTYTPEITDAILERLAAGESLRAICKGDDMPPESTVRRWAVEDTQGFASRYHRARDVGLDVMADELLEVADEAEVTARHDGADVKLALDATAVNRNRLRVDARKWYLSKLAPKKYGDRQAIEIAAPESSLAARLMRARQRVDESGR